MILNIICIEKNIVVQIGYANRTYYTHILLKYFTRLLKIKMHQRFFIILYYCLYCGFNRLENHRHI